MGNTVIQPTPLIIRLPSTTTRVTISQALTVRRQGDQVVKAVWGGITGDIDNQTDLQEALDGKLNLDQTVPQNVINGAPQFDGGIVIKKDQYLYLDGD